MCLSVDAVAEERERDAGESDGREEEEDVEREVARQGVDVGIEVDAVSDGGERETEQTRENHYKAGRLDRQHDENEKRRAPELVDRVAERCTDDARTGRVVGERQEKWRVIRVILTLQG